MHGIQCDIFLLKNGAIYCLTSFPYKSVYVHTRETASVKPKTYRIEVMNKKVTKTPTQKTTRRSFRRVVYMGYFFSSCQWRSISFIKE